MTEQVIDIRDRIEKMRTQMTGSPNPVPKKKEEFSNFEEKKVQSKSKAEKKFASQTTSESKESPANEKSEKVKQYEQTSKIGKVKQNDLDQKIRNEGISRDVFEDPKIDQTSTIERKNVIQSKIYKNYQNENIYDEKKNSVKFDQDQPFPQFNLNVSNPISWKLMLLIMLMQLLTNIMLVVVLYLK
ncbi:MAG: hypothetical protein CMM95_03205 [Rickettsiales bacterium]|nr:hypothetical protein [Rickettsiales bacterium]